MWTWPTWSHTFPKSDLGSPAVTTHGGYEAFLAVRREQVPRNMKFARAECSR